MGLKTTNYEVKDLGIAIPEAYARLTNININVDGMAFGTFEIHQTRKDLIENNPLERIHVNYVIDKDLPAHNQLYVKAKEEIFTDWEDDIVEEISIEEIESEVE
jgi:hypothetical protein